MGASLSPTGKQLASALKNTAAVGVRDALARPTARSVGSFHLSRVTQESQTDTQLRHDHQAQDRRDAQTKQSETQHGHLISIKAEATSITNQTHFFWLGSFRRAARSNNGEVNLWPILQHDHPGSSPSDGEFNWSPK